MAKTTPAIKIRSLLLERFSGALHRRLYFALREHILCGYLQNEQRLPSSRMLAKCLGISRNTVLRAYERLADAGYVAAAVGSGTRVRATEALLTRPAITPVGRTIIRCGLAEILEQSRYPLRRTNFDDSDGNSLYIYDSR